VEIQFQSHHAQVPDRMRERARAAVTRLAGRLVRVVNAVVRFEEDGPTRRVEIQLHAPRRRPVIAEGRARFFGPALTHAIVRLEAQARQLKRTPKTRGRKLARA
jgi:ribosome-associated translation inhibitor RaiA